VPAQPAEATRAPLQVATVRRGDIVISALGAGQVVARLDDTDAQQKVAQAEYDLSQAQQALAERSSPAALAAAQLDLVNKQIALASVEKALRNLQSANVSYYEDAVAVAQAAYTTAVANVEMNNLGSGSQPRALQNAPDNAGNAYSNWQQTINLYGENHNRTNDAKAAYDLALENLQVAQLRYDQAVASDTASLAAGALPARHR
jgi:multidrug resistance efflux pump